MTPQPILSLQDASLVLGGRPVLHGIRLQVQPGERVALIGPNGSGKTSLLRLLHGLVRCSSGVRAAERPCRMAMVFQKPFVLSLSTQANVRLALWLQGVPAQARRERCAQALARVGLAAQSRQRATTLSGGQQQRLALARAWAVQPAVLLLDEPTAALDPSAKREVETLMESLAEEGLTLFFSSHNLGQVKRLATRVVYLEDGQVLADMPVNQFFDDSQPNAAAAFLKGEMRWR